MTFYHFLMSHFKKNVKSHVFLKSEKNVKYVFSNTAYYSSSIHSNNNNKLFLQPLL